MIILPDASPRRLPVTVLMADIVDSTKLAELLSDDENARLVEAVIIIMAQSVEREGVSLWKDKGDGIMAVFGVRPILENHALSACRAAMSIIEQLSAPRRETGVLPYPRVRIGLNTGTVIIGDLAGIDGSLNIRGRHANIAARVEGCAEPNTILLTAETLDRARGAIEVSPMGKRQLKGIHTPIEVFQLTGLLRDERRSIATPFAGRGNELQELQTLWFRPRATQMPAEITGGSLGTIPVCVVDIVGAAGSGKSRLAEAFVARIKAKDVTIARAQARAGHRARPYAVVEQMLCDLASIDPGDSPREVELKLERLLREQQLSQPENVAVLLGIVRRSTLRPAASEGAQLQNAPTKGLFIDLVRSVIETGPLLLVVDDAHWADRASLDALAELAETVRGNAQCQVVLCSRPMMRDDAPLPGGTRTIQLPPLDPTDIARMIAEQLGEPALPLHWHNWFIERAEGNPLYAQELATYVLQKSCNVKQLLEQTPTAAKLGTVPDTLVGLVRARIDALTPEVQRVLTLAALIGPTFDRALIDALQGDTAVVDRALPELVRHGMLDALGVSDRGDEVFAFRNNLTREVLYGMSTNRAEIHRLIAEAMECLYGERCDDHAETLAQHYMEARRGQKAFEHLLVAGRKAREIGAITTAEQHLRAAYRLLVAGDARPRTMVERRNLFSDLLEILNLTTNSDEVVEICKTHPQIFSDADVDLRARLLGHYSWGLMTKGEFAAGYAAAQDAFALGNRVKDESPRAYAYGAAALTYAVTLLTKGAHQDPAVDLDGMVDAARASGDDYILNFSLFTAAWRAIHLGLIREATRYVDLLLGSAKSHGDRRAKGLALGLQSWIHIIGQDYHSALGAASRGLRDARTPLDMAISAVAHGIALVATGEASRGTAELQQAMDECQRRGWRAYAHATDMVLGVAKMSSDGPAAGFDHCHDSISRLEAAGYQVGADWIRLHMAELLLAERSSAEPTVREHLRVIMQRRLFDEGGVIYARALICDAELRRRSGDALGADALLEKAANRAQGQNAEHLSARISVLVRSRG